MLLDQVSVQIIPIRIQLLNQRQFPGAAAGFDLLLARDRLDHAFMKLVPDQYLAGVPFREARNMSFAMLERTFRQIAGHARVQRSVAPTGHDVDARLFHPPSLHCEERDDVESTTETSLRLPCGPW